MEGTVKKTAGVKVVVNKIVIAPVVLNSDLPLKQAADSILQKYPTAQAMIKDSIVAVEGTILKENAGEFFTALQSLNAKSVVKNTTTSNQ